MAHFRYFTWIEPQLLTTEGTLCTGRQLAMILKMMESGITWYAAGIKTALPCQWSKRYEGPMPQKLGRWKSCYFSLMKVDQIVEGVILGVPSYYPVPIWPKKDYLNPLELTTDLTSAVVEIRPGTKGFDIACSDKSIFRQFMAVLRFARSILAEKRAGAEVLLFPVWPLS